MRNCLLTRYYKLLAWNITDHKKLMSYSNLICFGMEYEYVIGNVESVKKFISKFHTQDWEQLRYWLHAIKTNH